MVLCHFIFLGKLRSMILRIYTSIDLTGDKIKESDCILILTDHDNIDYNLINTYAKLIVDTRNALRKRKIEIDERVVRL